MLNGSRGARSAMFSPDGLKIAGLGERAKLWDCETEELLWERKGRPIAFSPDGTQIAIVRRRGVRDGAWREGRLWLCDAETGDVTVELEAATACFDRHARLLTATSKPFSVAEGPARDHRIDLPKTPETAGTLSFSPGGKLLALEEAGDRVSVWDVEGRTRLWSKGPYGVDKSVGDSVELTFSPDASLLVVELDFSTKRQALDARTGKELLRFEYHRPEWYDAWLAFSADGRAAAVTAEGAVRLWDIRSRQAIETLPAWGSVRSVAFSPDGKIVALGREDGDVSLWRPGADRSVQASAGAVTFLEFAPDGERLAAVRPYGISLIRPET